MGLRPWWTRLCPEVQLVLVILGFAVTLCLILALASGCVATTEYVQMECARTDKTAEQKTWELIALTEEERGRINPSDEAAPALQLFALKKKDAVQVPAATPPAQGWAGTLAVIGAVMAALGIPGGLKLRSMAGALSQERDLAATYSQAIEKLKDTNSEKWRNDVAPMLRANKERNGRA